MTKNYSTIYEHTRKIIGDYAKENPEMMTAFSKVHQIGSKDGALNSKIKNLISLGISISSQCEGCITMHIHDAIENAVTHEEIVETIGTAIYMGGGPSVVYGAKAFATLQEFETLMVNQVINSINN